MGLVMRVCSRVIVLAFGRKIADADPATSAAGPGGAGRLPRDRRRMSAPGRPKGEYRSTQHEGIQWARIAAPKR